jgi:F-type H+-transporting ATPase subunit b
MHINWWTLALQTVNVLILIWLLARFFFRPVMAIVTERQDKANKLLSDAAAAQHAAEAARAEAEKLRAKINADRSRLIAEAQKAERAERDNLLAQTSQEIAKLRSDAAAVLVRDQAAAQEALLARAGDLAIDISRRLLSRLPHDAALSLFAEGLCDQLRVLPPEDRKSIASAAKDRPVEIITATQLSREETERIRAGIAEILGANLPISFRADASLLGGLELHSRNTIVSNSWRADLDRIRKELNRDRRHLES